MASAKVVLMGSTRATAEETEMVIVGGGLCGVLAARNCHERGIKYRLIEREACLGGNWHTLANSYSHLQAFEPNYRWDDKYRLNKDPLTKNSAADVSPLLLLLLTALPQAQRSRPVSSPKVRTGRSASGSLWPF